MIVQVPARGGLPLADLKVVQVVWAYFDQPEVRMPPGWEGSDERSAAGFRRGKIARGQSKPALQMHPPYRNGKGSVFAFTVPAERSE